MLEEVSHSRDPVLGDGEGLESDGGELSFDI